MNTEDSLLFCCLEFKAGIVQDFSYFPEHTCQFEVIAEWPDHFQVGQLPDDLFHFIPEFHTESTFPIYTQVNVFLKLSRKISLSNSFIYPHFRKGASIVLLLTQYSSKQQHFVQDQRKIPAAHF